MSNASPSPATRFPPHVSSNPGGKPSRAWIKKRLRSCRDGEDPEIQQILDHQIEVAKSWEIRIVGRDGKTGDAIKVASGRDSTEAAKFLFGLIGLKPLAAGEEPVRVPSEIAVGNRPLLDVISDLVRHRLVNGLMTEAELQKWTDTFLSVDQTKLRLVLALLGKGASGKSPEEVARMVAGVEALPTVSSVLPPADSGPKDDPVAATLSSASGNNETASAAATAGTIPDGASNLRAADVALLGGDDE